MNAINYSKSFDKLKIAEAVNSHPTPTNYGTEYRKWLNNPATLNDAIKELSEQIAGGHEAAVSKAIGSKAVDLIKKYNNE